jgi:Ca2+-binding RTX toxin-like protein
MAITGTNGDDDLFGTDGRNTIFGLRGWDRLVGLGGNDTLDGGRGNDLLEGNRGQDAFWGGRGKDLLDGGLGADNFWFNTRHSFDVINDFGGGDAVIIDVEDGGFEGVDRGDLLIERGSRFDRLYVDGDYVCKVFGEFLNYDEIFLL